MTKKKKSPLYPDTAAGFVGRDFKDMPPAPIKGFPEGLPTKIVGLSDPLPSDTIKGAKKGGKGKSTIKAGAIEK